MTTMNVGDFDGRETYALDLNELFIKMGNPERRDLIFRARSTGTLILDELEREIREGLTEAAAAEGDPAPRFERVDDHLMVTAQSPEVPHA